MESPLDDETIKPVVAQIKEIKLKMHPEKEFEETFSSGNDLNESGLPGTSETSKFVVTKPSKTKSFVNNHMLIDYAADNDWNKNLPNKEKPPKSSSTDLQPVSSDIDLILNIAKKTSNDFRKNILSVKKLKPSAVQLKEEAYNNHVKASMPLYFRFQFKKSLHEVVNPINKYKYKCHICKDRYIYKFSLKRHFVRNHVNPDYISVADLANCKVPVQNEKTIHQFVEKSKTSGRNRYSLPEGSSYFVPDGKTRISGLYKCHQCPGLKFDIEHELQEHYLYHLTTKNRDEIFTCDLCNREFDKKKALDEHVLSHTAKKFNFHCHKCPQHFEEITDYTCHLQSHTNGRRCKYCEREFSTPANRKRHENIHERGRVFPCLFCKTKFSQSHELEKHLKKMHSNLKFSCPHCPPANPEIFTSQHILEAHIALKHCNIPSKKIVTSNKTTRVYKSIGRKLSKECFCCYCKKKFSSVKAMVNHKNIIHKNEIALLKNKKFGGKGLVKEKSQGDSLSIGSRKLKTVPSKEKGAGEKNAASKVDDCTRKTGIFGKKRTTYERKAKSSLQYKLSKDKSYRKKDEAEKKFYSNISINVADNLLNYVDGGPNQINLKVSSFDDQNESFDYRPNIIEVPWSAHNFSNYFGNAVSRREEMSQLFPQEQCLYATGLERNEVSSEDILNLSSENSSALEETAHSSSQDSHLEAKDEKEKPINHDICVIYLCTVCKGTFSTYSALEDHFVNNHPNVEISVVEIEAPGKNPPEVPGELRRLPYTQPNGILVSCEVAQPTREQFDVKCTKCAARFNHLNDLHTHILKCATEARDTRFRRKLKSRCYRRNKFQGRKYYSSMQDNERDQRQLPLPSKLRPTSCPYNCTSVFISSQALKDHSDICIYRFKNDETRSKKKGKIRKKNDQSPELSPSPIPINENEGNSDAVKNSDIGNNDSSSLNCYKDNVLSNESQVVKSSSQTTLSTANHSLTAPLKSILEVSRTKENCSDISCEKIVVVERDVLQTSGPSLEVLRNLVREAESKLSEDLPVDDVGESCVKRKEAIPLNFTGKSMVKSSVDICLVDNSRRNISAKVGHNAKNVNISEQFTIQTKETSPGLGNNNLPKIKEVVKEMQLAASSLPNFKKSNAPLTFLSSEVNQNVEHSSPNNNSPTQIGVSSLSEKESGATNETQGSEKARQRKKRKPVKIMHKMRNETDNSHVNLSPFSNKRIDCLTPFTVENNSFKPIENSGEQMHSLDSEIPKLPDLVPEKDKIDFPNANEKCNADDQELSTTVFLPEVKPTSSGDRDSPSLEVLVSSVTQSIENFDKPSLLDDEKFALQAPDLINPTATKSTDMRVSSNNGLNFKIIIPTGESPSKSQVSDKDSLNYFTTEITVDKPTNESSLPVSSDKNNVKASVINKMKSILNVSDNVINAMKLKELIDNKVKNVSASAKNSVPVNNNISALTTHPQNSSATNSTTTNLLESVFPECQQSHSSNEDGKGLNEKYKELAGKSISRQKRDKKGADTNKGDGNKKGNDDDTSDSKKTAQGQFVMADRIDTISLASGQKSKLKDKVKFRMIEVGQSACNEIARTELQKKKANSKLSLNKNCDSINKDIPLKLPAENHKPEPALETNHQLTDKNEDSEGISSTSENSANLRFLRMKRLTPDECPNQRANKSTRPSNSSEIDILHHQTSERKKTLSNSGSVAAMNISETSAMLANSLESVTQTSIEISKDESNCKNNSSKSLDDLNSAKFDRDVVVKKEKPDNEPVKHRNCPYCYLDFAYLTNFKRHLLKCPSKPEDDASEAPVINQSQFQHLPKKNEVEESMLYLLRHQSRQNELIRDSQKTEDSKAKSSFQKYSCPECHKIYFSYWTYMRHKVKTHKMTNQEIQTTDSDGPLTFQEMHLEESNMHQETRAADPYGPSTSQGVRIAPLEENGYENNVLLPEDCDSNFTASDIPSELSANGKNSTSIVDSCEKETTQVNASKREGNSFSGFSHDELKLDNKGIASVSIPNAAECFGNMDSSGGSTSAEKTKTIDLSSDGRKVSVSPSDKEQPELSLLTLPAYGKGRGRKKKGVSENLTEKKRDLMTDVQSNKAEDISCVNEPKGDNGISKKEPAINNSFLKTVGKPDLSDLKSSPKNTLVNKLRNTLSKSMQIGNNLNTTALKFGRKSEMLKNADATDVKHVEKDSSSFKSPIKKNPMETSKFTDKTGVPGISQQLGVSRRGRKKSIVDRVSLKQNIRSFKQQCSAEHSQNAVPSDTNDSSVEVTETGVNSRLHDISKPNKLKSLRNQSHPGPGSSIVSDDKNSSIKKSITNTFQSSKMTKPVTSSKTSIQEVSIPDAQSSQKSSAVSNKVKSPRGIKANCDNEPTPSTSYGPSRGRKSRPMTISLDLSSELEDAEDFQQIKPKQKKKPNNKVCPICKQKFPTLLQRNRHLQLVHGRKRSRNEGSISPTLVPVKKETVTKVADVPAIVPDRSAYQRQCSKPLPPMKRKYEKVGVRNFQPVKKRKF